MNIQNYKEFWSKIFKAHKKGKKDIQFVLDNVLNKIKFLESIYMTGGSNNHFSEEFRDSAYKERQESCQESSALYAILKDDYKSKVQT